MIADYFVVRSRNLDLEHFGRSRASGCHGEADSAATNEAARNLRINLIETGKAWLARLRKYADEHGPRLGARERELLCEAMTHAANKTDRQRRARPADSALRGLTCGGAYRRGRIR